jgi:nucleotide-binding universal stress UspA family protein
VKRILAAIDTSIYADSVVDHAAWAARLLGASVEILHVIPPIDSLPGRSDLSGALGLGAKSGLMEELVSLAEVQGRLARAQGEALLAAAAARLAGAGVADTTTLHRHGGVVETLIEREAEADLVLIGKRGEQADFARGHIGSLVERLVRESIRPVLVTARRYGEPRTAVIAFDGGASARQAVAFLAASPLARGMTLHLVSVGTLDATRRAALDAARAALPEAVVHEVSGTPDAAIERVVAAVGAELLVMGAYGHSPLRTFILGSTTTALMRACRVSVLLFR